eukprot:jgi/Mesvir1/24775/Mv22030-RA.1
MTSASFRALCGGSSGRSVNAGNSQSVFKDPVQEDVEKHGERIRALSSHIKKLHLADMDKAVEFADIMDSHLALLADQRATLKLFDCWPVKKEGTMEECLCAP